jgi:hypothetical protein
MTTPYLRPVPLPLTTPCSGARQAERMDESTSAANILCDASSSTCGYFYPSISNSPSCTLLRIAPSSPPHTPPHTPSPFLPPFVLHGSCGLQACTDSSNHSVPGDPVGPDNAQHLLQICNGQSKKRAQMERLGPERCGIIFLSQILPVARTTKQMRMIRQKKLVQ